MLLYVRYSGGDDIIAIAIDKNGDVTESITGIDGFGRFVNPVDLTEDPATGNLYVAEFGGKRITLVRALHAAAPATSPISHRTARTPCHPSAIMTQ